MRVEYLDDKDFKVFLNNCSFEEINYESKEELMAFLKSTIVKLKKIYNMIITGFYEVNIYILRNIGIELLFYKKDDYTFSSKVIDLKMTIHLEPSVYLAFDNYDYIDNYDFVKVKDGTFYIDPGILSDDDIIKLSDFYLIVIDESIDDYKEIKTR